MPIISNKRRIGDYQITGEIGRGGFGVVYKAIARGMEFAIKSAYFPELVSLYKEEFAVLKTLSHPHLPKYYELFVVDDIPYIVMDYVKGPSFQEMTLRQRRLPDEIEVARLALQVCNALIYLHEHDPRVLHRDIKPDNIRIGLDGLVKLVDFGLIKVGEKQTEDAKKYLLSSHFAPIEQYSDIVNMTGTVPQSDIYSLGATIYYILTRVPPENSFQRYLSNKTITKPSSINPTLSVNMENIVLKALQLHSKDRFSSCSEMKNELESHIFSITQPLKPTDQICRECGKGNNTHAKYCPDCGNPLPRFLRKFSLNGAEKLKVNLISSDTPQSSIVSAMIILPGKEQFTLTSLKQEYIIGRLDPSLAVPDIDLSRYSDSDSVSRRHARIAVYNDKWTIEDTNSSNGVFINGRRILREIRQEVLHGDKIRLGSVELTFCIVDN